ncbi:bifunctional 2-C-methyl-D-erythritol 4-phosphate cytidylyltransferase/2-C-methyl-D-erythritol 2,4-cyclodiphosphate synthase [Helicobacter mustelae]|uniref:Bifunctional enzyme IspD/IspF n=1 Tax=Helicobacter mustelae (strain ATCC 43772 / CCUG 25715 / CIP 103759 / LMG 18044 / NCTC 12198 / R85-136P) TaxID=679897 RepID=D3UJD1_HELM1|nr:bifunctional 2-C-methyl-D-erythritol 4-phosphate cytidylyltransferase/2-C-methyl-D-erythritol 2,4-cyclodiphosphate synthase [Helicobacter mustelae]CBG40606.1 putative bifunctional enzyme ispD/ispF, IspDF [Helicobacter mustelae 12198]SQH72104.1 bifunctional enzyme ispD/ispF, IspDF [Helicobacter mustelae]STP13247.1 bifunctional enzyme ispD/ispF, IspDF [Helicobacter mustelae]
MHEKICLILLAAGDSTRFSAVLPFEKRVKKQWLRIGILPLWKYVLEKLKSLVAFEEILVVMDEEGSGYARNFVDAERIVVGGETRAQSLRNALEFVQSPYVFVTDVARCEVDETVCQRLLEARGEYDCVVPYVECVDTAWHGEEILDRSAIKLIQTPQISESAKLKNALCQGDFSDESSAMHACGYRVGFVRGSARMRKLTYLQDLEMLKNPPSSRIFVGQGWDIHAFEEDRPMVLGGVKIPSNLGLRAHSDGDVVLHALIDGLLGAACAGDIGEWFPDNDATYHNIDSRVLLEKIRAFIVGVGFEIVHLDVSIFAQIPKIVPHKADLQESIASLLHLSKHCVNIKATTTEGMGFVGRKEGICVNVSATLKFLDWREL